MENLFLFEFATCGAFPELKPSITVEGMGMFKTIFEGFCAMGIKPTAFVDERIEGDYNLERAKDYQDKFQEYLDRAETALVIAPETNMILFGFTEAVEGSGAGNLGSSAEGVRRASDKWLTYQELGGLMPRTELYGGTTKTGFPLVAKPRDGVSCEGIFMVRGEEDLSKVPEGYILQEYSRGRAMSASVMCGDETRVLSVQTQEIEGFQYRGAMVPAPPVDPEPIIQAVEKVPGLFGLVGVDFIDTGQGIKIIEINARPTTPIMAFERAYGLDVAEAIYKNYYKEHIPEVEKRSQVLLKKERGEGGYVSFGGYTIRLEVRI